MNYEVSVYFLQSVSDWCNKYGYVPQGDISGLCAGKNIEFVNSSDSIQVRFESGTYRVRGYQTDALRELTDLFKSFEV